MTLKCYHSYHRVDVLKIVLRYLHSCAFTEISLRSGNSHCLFMITALLVGGKEDLFAFFIQLLQALSV